METVGELPTKLGNVLPRSSVPLTIEMLCHNVIPLISNRTGNANGQQVLPAYIRQLFATKNLTFHLSESIGACLMELTHLNNNTDPLSSLTSEHRDSHHHHLRKYSLSLLTFVVLIGFVSIISIIGNLCLAKVIYAKRLRLIQTDRIVLCLALSKWITRRNLLPTRRLFLHLFRWTRFGSHWHTNGNLSISLLFVYPRMAVSFSHVLRSNVLVVHHLLSSLG